MGAVRVGLILVLAPASAAWAQEGRPLSSVDPSGVVSRSRAASGSIELPTVAPSADQDRVPRFVLADAIFDGVKAIPVSALRPAWTGMRNKRVALADLSAIALRAEAIYARMGFPFVAVVVTPQKVDDGVVHFKVVEGHISDVKVLGSDPAARRQTAAAFGPLINREPLSSAAVEWAYERAKAVPGLAIAGSLRRGNVAGGMDLVMQSRRRTWTTYANVNDYYPDVVGPWGVLVGVDHYGASRYGDESSLQAYTSINSGSQVVLRASHQQTLNARGTTVSAMALAAWAHPGGSVAELELATKVYAGRIGVSQPLIARLRRSLTVTAAVDVNDQTTKVFNSIGLTEDRLRVVSLSLAGELRGRAGAHIGIDVEGRKGLDMLGASRPDEALASRLGADPQAAVGRVSMEGETPLVWRAHLAGRFEGQVASAPLTAPEQYVVGNLTIGRGYQPGAAFADEVLAGSGELRVGPFKTVRSLRIEPFVFYDVVRMWSLTPGASSARTLSSMGGGMRVEAPGRMHVDLTYAMPQSPPFGLGEPTPPGRIMVNVTVGLNDAFNAIHRRLFRGEAK